jgi:hypothetical protein
MKFHVLDQIQMLLMLLIVFFHYITSSAFQQSLKLSNFCLGLKHVFQLLKMRHTSLSPGKAGPYKQPLREPLQSPYISDHVAHLRSVRG